MSAPIPNPKDQNDELLRLIAANKARLAKLQKTIADLQRRTSKAAGTPPPEDPARAPKNAPPRT